VIADVVFDLPRASSFSYAVPAHLCLAPGQRVAAPLRGRLATGVVVGIRPGEEPGLKAIERAVDPVPLVGAAALDLTRWAADESLSSWGSTLLALLPPPPPRGSAEPAAPPLPPGRAAARPPELWLGSERGTRLAERLREGAGSALVIAPDREEAARWAGRLDAARLDSGMSDRERRAAWLAAARGRARVVVGTRSALLAPLPPPVTLALLDEADPAHKPPGHPRIHSREVVIRRAGAEGAALYLLAAAPAVETWHRAEREGWPVRDDGAPGWPEVVTGDPRGVLRNHPLTLPLTRAIEDMTRAGRSVALLVSRRPSALGCAECGALLRCPTCGVSLGHARGRASLACGLCGRAEPLPDRCPGCGGHRLLPLGWDAERVETSVRRRFPRLTVSRRDPHAQVLIGGAPALRAVPPGRLGAAGVIALDGLLGMPDFRAGERAFGLLWAAAEAVGPDGRLVVQTLHPDHEAVDAVRRRDRESFYRRELDVREALGYPPYRRLCLISVRGPAGRELIEACAASLSGAPGLTVYPPASAGTGGAAPRWRLLVKGPAALPELLRGPLADLLRRRRRGGAVVEIEMDPVS
jgi:primosomal protein N' (replication factor Y)